jgi:hypothetical protein
MRGVLWPGSEYNSEHQKLQTNLTWLMYHFMVWKGEDRDEKITRFALFLIHTKISFQQVQGGIP